MIRLIGNFHIPIYSCQIITLLIFSALDLMRRLPPSQIENNLQGLIDLLPDIVEDLLSAIDQPLKVAHDSSQKKDYLLCDYNRDGDSYRYL